MKKALLILAVSAALFSSCSQEDDFTYPDAPEMPAPSSDDPNDENGPKGGGS